MKVIEWKLSAKSCTLRDKNVRVYHSWDQIVKLMYSMICLLVINKIKTNLKNKHSKYTFLNKDSDKSSKKYVKAIIDLSMLNAAMPFKMI